MCEELSAAKEPHRRMARGTDRAAQNIELLKLGYRIRRARKVLGYNQKVFASKV